MLEKTIVLEKTWSLKNDLTNLLYKEICLRLVAEKNPLQQGLKLRDGNHNLKIRLVAEKNPLQQGLKQI